MSSSERQACGDALPYQAETTIPESLLEYLGNNKPRLGRFGNGNLLWVFLRNGGFFAFCSVHVLEIRWMSP